MNEFAEIEDNVEGLELEEEELSAGGEKGGKGIVFILVIVLVLAFQAVSSYFILQKLVFSEQPAQPKKEVRDSEPREPGQVFQLTGIIVNPQGTRGTRHLLVDIGFETYNPDVILELEEMQPLIQDNINTFLSAQRFEVLTDITMRDRLRRKLKEIANFYLAEGEVENVFFTRYVVQ